MNKTVNAAKGIGISLVLIAHAMEGVLGKIIFSFHMPFFFILSGMLYKGYENSEFIIKKTRRLLAPYFFFTVIFLSLGFIQLYYSDKLSINSALEIIKKNIYGGSYLSGWQSVFWFISVMYISIITYNFMARKLTDIKLMIVISIILTLAYIYSFLPHPKIPFGIDICFFSIPLIYLGHKLKHQLESSSMTLSIILLLPSVMLNVFTPVHFSMDMKYVHFGIPLLGLISSLAATKIIFWISRNLIANLKLFVLLGECSMMVMYIHQFIRLVFFSPHITQKWLVTALTMAACIAICFIYKQMIVRKEIYILKIIN